MKDVIISTLKRSWFELARQEDYPYTPKITEELDVLTSAIRREGD